MSTVILRPNGIEAGDTGFDQTGSNLLERINDNDTGTGVNQTSVTATFTVSFPNDSSYQGATINSVTVSTTATTSGKAAECEIQTQLFADGASAIAQNTATFTSAGGITTSTFVHSTALTPSRVDDMTVTVTPDNAGASVREIFKTVDFTASPSRFLSFSEGKITLSSGKVTI